MSPLRFASASPRPASLEEPQCASSDTLALQEILSLPSEAPSPITLNHSDTRPALFHSHSPARSQSPQTPPPLPDLRGSTSPQRHRSGASPSLTSAGVVSRKGENLLEEAHHRLTGRSCQLAWTSSSLSSGEVVEALGTEALGTDSHGHSLTAAANPDADLAYVPVHVYRHRVSRHGSSANSRVQTPSPSRDVGVSLPDTCLPECFAAIEGQAEKPQKKDPVSPSAERMSALNPPPLLQATAVAASPPPERKNMATDGNETVQLAMPQLTVKKLESQASVGSSSGDEDRVTPEIDLVALAKRVGASPEQTKKKFAASSSFNTHKGKNGSGSGVNFAPAPEVALIDKPSYPTTDEGPRASGDWRRRSSALAFEARRMLSEPENSLSPPCDPTRKPSPPRTPGRIRSLSLSIGADMKCQILKQEQEVAAAEAAEEAKKEESSEAKKQRWRRRTTASHLMIPQAEGGLAAADGSEELERLRQHNRDIRDGDAGDAISVRSAGASTTPSESGGWKRRGSALAERAVFMPEEPSGTESFTARTPSPPRSPGRNRTLSLSVPPDLLRETEEQQRRDEKQEEALRATEENLNKLQAEQKALQQLLQEQAEQHRRQMQQQQELLETLLQQQRHLEEKEKEIEKQQQELNSKQQNSSQTKEDETRTTRQTLTGQQRQQLQDQLKQLQYIQQNRPRKSKAGGEGLTETGSASAESKAAETTSSSERITNPFSVVDRIHKYLVDPEVLLVDVRSPQEFGVEKISGSINLPSEQFLACLHLLPQNKETPLLVYCSDGTRARQAANALRKLGHTNVCDAGSIRTVKHALDGAVVSKARMLAEKQAGETFASYPGVVKGPAAAFSASPAKIGPRLSKKEGAAPTPPLSSAYVHPDIDDSLVELLLLRVELDKVSCKTDTGTLGS
ncbi:rhodanese family domain-containing protein [Cystoisospora suis]|uniref:Rhodanese family domain-containing protein n=1 Tax=Cystoisospora suis TaxID=483139 RepID=A0A2C6KNM7_9APIC|nr:rhodanese family domain-containing protein [Cystoisospora suis]